jgi:hypothetical protein
VTLFTFRIIPIQILQGLKDSHRLIAGGARLYKKFEGKEFCIYILVDSAYRRHLIIHNRQVYMYKKFPNSKIKLFMGLNSKFENIFMFALPLVFSKLTEICWNFGFD